MRSAPCGFTAVTGRASDDIWASTSSALYHWNGVNWSNMGAVSSAADLWASGPNEVFVLGANHTSYFNLATSIDLGVPTNNNLRAIVGNGPRDFFALGDGIARWH